MHSKTTLRTACGAVAFVLALSLSVAEANAATNGNPAVQSSEETFGPHKYQVARLVVNATPAQVQSVLTDYCHTAQMFPKVKECKVVEDDGPNKKVAFTACTAANLWTFSYVLQVHETPGYIDWHRVSGAFKLNEGFWKMEPLDGGRATLVTFAKFIDGGLLIPQALVVHELRTSMPEIMLNLKTSTEERTHVAQM
jgi:hypothetical protein